MDEEWNVARDNPGNRRTDLVWSVSNVRRQLPSNG